MGATPRKLDITMSDEEYARLKEAVTSKKVDYFVEEFRASHPL
jgi:hypothetical protein